MVLGLAVKKPVGVAGAPVEGGQPALFSANALSHAATSSSKPLSTRPWRISKSSSSALSL